MIIASDYSGQHKEATHEAYSFLVTTDEALKNWLPSLAAFRQQWLPDGRSISFKKLNEPLRRQALRPFLDTAAGLSGNLIKILVNREVGSFISGGPALAKDVFPDCFQANASLGTVEKMLRLASFVGLILAGLRLFPPNGFRMRSRVRSSLLLRRPRSQWRNDLRPSHQTIRKHRNRYRRWPFDTMPDQ
ncbi:MAG: hypothetical protein QOI49_2425 [Verrucomicrobiota bacterium]|jgi:hypothetical protein